MNFEQVKAGKKKKTTKLLLSQLESIALWSQPPVAAMRNSGSSNQLRTGGSFVLLFSEKLQAFKCQLSLSTWLGAHSLENCCMHTQGAAAQILNLLAPYCSLTYCYGSLVAHCQFILLSFGKDNEKNLAKPLHHSNNYMGINTVQIPAGCYVGQK